MYTAPGNDSAAIVAGLIAIAQTLGIHVVAEGIETPAFFDKPLVGRVTGNWESSFQLRLR